MEPVLIFDIRILGMTEVKGKSGEALMIAFDGTSDCEEFHGKVLPGGMDTQKEWYGSRRQLSARYMLEGVDREGKKCRIFVENNGTAEADGFVRTTKPVIITDSTCLAWMEKACLKGTFEPLEGGVRISIYEKV